MSRQEDLLFRRVAWVAISATTVVYQVSQWSQGKVTAVICLNLRLLTVLPSGNRDDL